jgi:hypothetical protein
MIVLGDTYGFVDKFVEVFNLGLSFHVTWSNCFMFKSRVFSKFCKYLRVEWQPIVTLEDLGNPVCGENLL